MPIYIYLSACPPDRDLSGRGHCVGVILIFPAHAKVGYLDDVIVSYPSDKIMVDAIQAIPSRREGGEEGEGKAGSGRGGGEKRRRKFIKQDM